MATAMGTYVQGDVEVPPRPSRSARQSDADENGGARLARALGWFSIGLGLAEVLAPDAMARLVGAEPDDGTTQLMRAFGLREISSGVGILSGRQTETWVRSRVAGDVLDLAMLGKTMVSTDDRARTIGATVAVLGVAALDLLAAEKLAATDNQPRIRQRAPDRVRVRRTITIGRPTDEVYAFWRNFENMPRFMRHLESVRNIDATRSHWTAKAGEKTVEWDAEITEDRPDELIAWRTLHGADVEHDGRVRFVRAPGDRGTEVHVDLAYDPPGGRISAMVAKLFREAPGQQAQDDLYNLKQLLETGEITLADATLSRGPHAAQPDA
jgi:uncharacterized membrane protein